MAANQEQQFAREAFAQDGFAQDESAQDGFAQDGFAQDESAEDAFAQDELPQAQTPGTNDLDDLDDLEDPDEDLFAYASAGSPEVDEAPFVEEAEEEEMYVNRPEQSASGGGDEDIASIMERMVADSQEEEERKGKYLVEQARVQMRESGRGSMPGPQAPAHDLSFLDPETLRMINMFTNMDASAKDPYESFIVAEEKAGALPAAQVPAAIVPLPAAKVAQKMMVRSQNAAASSSSSSTRTLHLDLERRRGNLVYRMTPGFAIQCDSFETYLKTLKRKDVSQALQAVNAVLENPDAHPVLALLVHGRGYLRATPEERDAVDSVRLRSSMVSGFVTVLVFATKGNYESYDARNYPLIWRILVMANYMRHNGAEPEALADVNTLLQHAPNLFWSTMRCLLGWHVYPDQHPRNLAAGITGLPAFVSRVLSGTEAVLDLSQVTDLTINRAIYLMNAMVQIRAGYNEPHLGQLRLTTIPQLGPLSGTEEARFRLTPFSLTRPQVNARLSFLLSLLTGSENVLHSSAVLLSADELYDFERCFMPQGYSEELRKLLIQALDKSKSKPPSAYGRAAMVEAPYPMSTFAVSVLPSLYYERYDSWLTWSRSSAGKVVLPHPVLLVPWPTRPINDAPHSPLIAWEILGAPRKVKVHELACALTLFLPLTNLQGYHSQAKVRRMGTPWKSKTYTPHFYALFACHVSRLLSKNTADVSGDETVKWDPWLLVLMDVCTLQRVLPPDVSEEWFESLLAARDALVRFDKAQNKVLSATRPSKTHLGPKGRKKKKNANNDRAASIRPLVFITKGQEPAASPMLNHIPLGDDGDTVSVTEEDLEPVERPPKLSFRAPTVAYRRRAARNIDEDDVMARAIAAELNAAPEVRQSQEERKAPRWNDIITFELQTLRMLRQRPVIAVSSPFNQRQEDLELDAGTDLCAGVLRIVSTDDKVFYASPPVRWGMQWYVSTQAQEPRFHPVYPSFEGPCELSAPAGVPVDQPLVQVLRTPPTYTQPVFVSKSKEGVIHQVEQHLMQYHQRDALRLSDYSEPDGDALPLNIQSTAIVQQIRSSVKSELASRRHTMQQQIAASRDARPDGLHYKESPRRSRVSALSGMYEDSVIFQNFSLESWYVLWDQARRRWEQLLQMEQDVENDIMNPNLQLLKDAQMDLWRHTEKLVQLSDGVYSILESVMFASGYALSQDGPGNNDDPDVDQPDSPVPMTRHEEKKDEEAYSDGFGTAEQENEEVYSDGFGTAEQENEEVYSDGFEWQQNGQGDDYYGEWGAPSDDD